MGERESEIGGGSDGGGGDGGGGGGWRGEGAGGTDRQTERDLHSEFICFSTVLQVTAVEVKPI